MNDSFYASFCKSVSLNLKLDLFVSPNLILGMLLVEVVSKFLIFEPVL